MVIQVRRCRLDRGLILEDRSPQSLGCLC
jgi:hypothetical protein